MPNPAFEPGRLRLARELRSLSQTELATQAEITGAAVSQFESGATRPTEATIEGMAMALNVPTEFFGLPDDETHEGFFRSLRRTTITDRRRARAIARIAHDAVVLGSAEQRYTQADIPRLPASGLETSADEMEEAAACLGATRLQVFTRIILPQVLPALMAGFAMAFARALGEYGSVIFIAGNMPYKSEIVPLIIVIKLEQYDYAGATAIALVMLIASFIMLLVINLLMKWSHIRRGGGMRS